MLRIQSGQQVRSDITDVWRALVHCFQNVLYVAAIQLEKAGLDHLLRHILAVDADGRSGRADSIKEMLAIAESSRPWIHHRKRKGRSLHNRGCDQSLIRKYFLMNGNGIDAPGFSPDASIPFPFKWRWHPDLNWGMRVLQTLALPLGHVTIISKKPA